MNLTIYILTAVVLVAFSLLDILKINKKIKKFFSWLLIIALSVYAALRSSAMPDTEAYILYFNDVCSSNVANPTFELGFFALTKFISFFTNNYQIYFFIIAFLQLFLAKITFCNNRYVLLPIALFFSFYGFYFSFSILRAGISILLFTFVVLKVKKNFCIKILLLLLSCLFHRSAIFAVLAYVLFLAFGKKLYVKNIIAVILILLSILLCQIYASRYIVKSLIDILEILKSDNLLFVKMYTYSLKIYENLPTKLANRYLFNIITYFAARYFLQIDTKISKDNRIFIIDKIVLFGLIFEGFFGSNVLTNRITDFTNIFNICNLLIIASVILRKNDQLPNFSIRSKRKNTAVFISTSVDYMLYVVIVITISMMFMYRIWSSGI